MSRSILICIVLGLLGCRGENESPVPPKREPDPADAEFRAAATWLRAFAPRRYAKLDDAEVRSLETIRLHAAPLSTDLHHLTRFESLTHLEIWDEGDGPAPDHPVGVIDDAAVGLIAGIATLRRLELGGWNMKYTDVGLGHLTRLPALESLNLCQCPGVTDDGMTALQGLGKLRRLDLTYTHVSDIGLERLLAIASLTDVSFGWAGKSARALARFKAKHPDRPFLR